MNPLLDTEAMEALPITRRLIEQFVDAVKEAAYGEEMLRAVSIADHNNAARMRSTLMQIAKTCREEIEAGQDDLGIATVALLAVIRQMAQLGLHPSGTPQ